MVKLRLLLFSISIISVDQDKGKKSYQENLTYMKIPFGTLMSECIGPGLLSTNLSSFRGSHQVQRTMEL